MNFFAIFVFFVVNFSFCILHFHLTDPDPQECLRRPRFPHLSFIIYHL